jgi:hypothetical protein
MQQYPDKTQRLGASLAYYIRQNKKPEICPTKQKRVQGFAKTTMVLPKILWENFT